MQGRFNIGGAEYFDIKISVALFFCGKRNMAE